MTPATLALALLATALPPGDQRPPNVVVVLADDLGYGDLGSYGGRHIRTPNLDRLAAEGARLTDFYVTHPYCTPTRAALLTGRHPIRTGLTRVLSPHSEGGLEPAEVTLAELLRDRGYVSGVFGKWHLGHRPESLPTRNGFATWFGMPWPNDQDDKHFAAAEHGWGPLPLYRDEEVVERPAVQATLSKRYTDEAIAFIEANADRPFFAYLAHSMPHLWLAADEPFRGKSAHGDYGDAVEELDFHLGRLMAAIKARGLDDRTLVIFFSDNGPVTAHRQLPPGDPRGSAGPLRAGKGTVFEGGVRVPMIARWPGTIPAGRAPADPAISYDLFATIAARSGPASPDGRPIDGRDLLPMLTGEGPREGGPESPLFFYRAERLAAVRSGPWKLHLAEPAPAPAKKKAGGRGPLLFNLADDPGESTDLASREPEVVRRLTALADAFRRDLGPVPATQQ